MIFVNLKILFQVLKKFTASDGYINNLKLELFNFSNKKIINQVNILFCNVLLIKLKKKKT